MSDYSGSDDERKEETSIASDQVVNKYKVAADITNAALKEVIEALEPGKNTLDLCKLGDKKIKEGTDALFKKQKSIKKGIAWPTCVSVNNVMLILDKFSKVYFFKN